MTAIVPRTRSDGVRQGARLTTSPAAASIGIDAVTSPAPRALWTQIVRDDPTSMADHSPEWTDAIIATGPYCDASRLYELSDGRRLVVPMVRRTGLASAAGMAASFPEGWGFGGIVGAGRDPRAIRLLLDDLQRRRGVYLRLRPDPFDADLWAEAAPDGIVTTPKRAHVLDLTPSEEELRRGLQKERRRSLRKAEEGGLRVELDTTGALLPTYYGLYEKSLARWAARSHEPVALATWRGRRRDPLSKLQTIATYLGDRFRLWMAFVDDRPAAGGITLLGNTAHDTRGAMDRELAGPTSANILLQWLAILDAKAAGATTMHLGESGTSATLASYKEHYGARSVPYRDYRIERLPVTRADRAARELVKSLVRFREG